MNEVTRKIEAATLHASPEDRDKAEIRAMFDLLKKQPEGTVVFRRRDAKTGEMRAFLGTEKERISARSIGGAIDNHRHRKFSTIRRPFL